MVVFAVVLESVSTTILRDNGVEFSIDDSLQKKVKKCFSSLEIIKRISSKDSDSGKSIVNSFANISKSIGELRNNHGFISHGRDLQEEKFDRYLLELSIESSKSITCFLIKAHDEYYMNKKRIYYEDYKKFNLYLDETSEEYPSFHGIEMEPSKFLFYDIEAYKESFIEFDEERELIYKEFEEGFSEYELLDFVNFIDYFEKDQLLKICEKIIKNFKEEYIQVIEKLIDVLDIENDKNYIEKLEKL